MRNDPRQQISPSVNIRVSGSLFRGHLSYLDQLVASAIECVLWPMLDLSRLEEVDKDALLFLMSGEGRHFGIIGCPNFIREWMEHEKSRCAA